MPRKCTAIAFLYGRLERWVTKPAPVPSPPDSRPPTDVATATGDEGADGPAMILGLIMETVGALPDSLPG